VHRSHAICGPLLWMSKREVHERRSLPTSFKQTHHPLLRSADKLRKRIGTEGFIGCTRIDGMYHPLLAPSLTKATRLRRKILTLQLSLPTGGSRPRYLPHNKYALPHLRRSFPDRYTVPLISPGSSPAQINHHPQFNAWSHRVDLGATRKYISCIFDILKLI
jgi:hypothetical protein